MNESPEAVYLSAVSEYEQGRYDAAIDLFCYLSEKAPQQPEIWKGLAACRQVQQEYSQAVVAWGMAAILDKQDPEPHFHAAECLAAQGDFVEAKKAICTALSLPCPEQFLDQMVRLKEIIDHGI